MKKTVNYNLLVVAHPDDESIFFAGLLLKKSKIPWKIICMTDANADGHGIARLNQFRRAAKLLKAKKIECWKYPDIYEQRLPVEEISQRLLQKTPGEKILNVYTHGIIGEYGHPHHQDVSAAVFMAFPESRIRSVAYNCFPEEVVPLTAKDYALKTKVLSKIYHDEIRRFSNFLPATSSEGFARVTKKEVLALYRFFTKGAIPNLKDLKVYRWYWPYLLAQKKKALPRPF